MLLRTIGFRFGVLRRAVVFRVLVLCEFSGLSLLFAVMGSFCHGYTSEFLSFLPKGSPVEEFKKMFVVLIGMYGSFNVRDEPFLVFSWYANIRPAPYMENLVTINSVLHSTITSVTARHSSSDQSYAYLG